MCFCCFFSLKCTASERTSDVFLLPLNVYVCIFFLKGRKKSNALESASVWPKNCRLEFHSKAEFSPKSSTDPPLHLRHFFFRERVPISAGTCNHFHTSQVSRSCETIDTAQRSLRMHSEELALNLQEVTAGVGDPKIRA